MGFGDERRRIVLDGWVIVAFNLVLKKKEMKKKSKLKNGVIFQDQVDYIYTYIYIYIYIYIYTYKRIF